MQFYILMVDYGRDTSKQPNGFEAVVSPELTRADIVDQVRDINKHPRNAVVFVKLVDGNHIYDVTDDIFEDAGLVLEAAE